MRCSDCTGIYGCQRANIQKNHTTTKLLNRARVYAVCVCGCSLQLWYDYPRVHCKSCFALPEFRTQRRIMEAARMTDYEPLGEQQPRQQGASSGLTTSKKVAYLVVACTAGLLSYWTFRAFHHQGEAQNEPLDTTAASCDKYKGKDACNADASCKFASYHHMQRKF